VPSATNARFVARDDDAHRAGRRQVPAHVGRIDRVVDDEHRRAPARRERLAQAPRGRLGVDLRIADAEPPRDLGNPRHEPVVVVRGHPGHELDAVRDGLACVRGGDLRLAGAARIDERGHRRDPIAGGEQLGQPIDGRSCDECRRGAGQLADDELALALRRRGLGRNALERHVRARDHDRARGVADVDR